jgi:hypothetical protein
VLHSERKRIEELAKREASGESLWTDSFSEPIRTKIFYAYSDTAGDYGQHGQIRARGLILRDLGLFELHDNRRGESGDLFAYFMECESSEFPSVVEALIESLRLTDKNVYDYMHPYPESYKKFTQEVNEILLRERISFEIIDSEMVEYASLALHALITKPVLTLIGNSPDWKPVESAFQNALREIAEGHAADAITDAATALQETLQILGCDGKTLGTLVNSAKAKGLLASQDVNLTNAIESGLKWVAAERNERSDAHKAEERPTADAWLIVHVVGALILRLAQEEGR